LDCIEIREKYHLTNKRNKTKNEAFKKIIAIISMLRFNVIQYIFTIYLLNQVKFIPVE